MLDLLQLYNQNKLFDTFMFQFSTHVDDNVQ